MQIKSMIVMSCVVAVYFANVMTASAAITTHDTTETAATFVADYNVVWDSQSKSSADSMPLAGGILGLNVWVENDDLLFLIGSPNCLNENGMQVKIGLVRLRFSPTVFSKAFKQELRLGSSEIVVSGKTESGNAVEVKLWCDVNDSVVHVEAHSAEALTVEALYETWAKGEMKFVNNGLQWMRRNDQKQDRRASDMKAQGMEEFAEDIPDPLTNLTCGGLMSASGMEPGGLGSGNFNNLPTRTAKLKTIVPVKTLALSIAVRMEQDDSVSEWEKKLAKLTVQAVEDKDKARQSSLTWWRDFWSRSHIVINPGAPSSDKAWQAGRNYQLSRYQLAANRNGRMMTLFNGGNFTCTGNPDQRHWEFCQFMGQNQMLVYWPLQRSGDFDLLKVGCDFYSSITPMRRLHARKFWGIDGVTFPEPLGVFGLDALGTNADGRSNPKHLHYHYTSGMVFALMMLGHDTYSGCITPGYSEAALGLISYYDNYYQQKLMKETGKPLDDNGKLVIYPSDACEPYHGCKNNIDVLAGLKALVRDLLETPDGVLNAEQRDYVKGFASRIANFKLEEKDGRTLYAAADEPPEWIFHNKNMDFPQMYICFPFSAVSLGRSDMELVKNTWELGPVNPVVQHQNHCWYQNAINLARMGDTTRAVDFTLKKLLHPGLRFPTFYYTHYLGGGSFCHPPDTDHAGVAMTALQEMLMQTDGKRILLGAAWPSDWNCDFKLHAPYQTTVEGRVVDGAVVIDCVSPESRRQDITVFPLKSLPPPPVSENCPATASTVYNADYDAGKAVDSHLATRWSMSSGNATGWLEVDLGSPKSISRVVIQEKSYPQTSKFAIEALHSDGTWKSLVEGDSIGIHKELSFAPHTAQRFRLNIKGANLHNAGAGVTIDEFQLFKQ